MRQIALATIDNYFHNQLQTATELIDNPLETRRAYSSPNFDRNFALLSDYGVATTLKVPTAAESITLYYLDTEELICLNSRELISEYLPPLFEQLSVACKGEPSDFAQSSRQTPEEEFSEMYKLKILSRTKIFDMKKTALIEYLNVNNIHYDPKTKMFLEKIDKLKEPLCPSGEFEIFFSPTKEETQIFYVDFRACKDFLTLETSVRYLKDTFDDIFACSVFAACLLVETTNQKFTLTEYMQFIKNCHLLHEFQHILQQLQQTETARQMLEFASAAGFILEVGEYFEVEFAEFLEQIRLKIGCCLLQAKNEEMGRVFALLTENGSLDEYGIAQEGLLTLEDAQRAANQLFEEGFLTCQKMGDNIVYSVAKVQFIKSLCQQQGGVLARLLESQKSTIGDLEKGSRLLETIVQVTESFMVFL